MARRYPSAPPKLGTTRVNKYPGTCHWCKAPLAAEAGVVIYDGTWRAQHRPLVPATGPWDRDTGGCPASTDDDAAVAVMREDLAADREWAAMGAYVDAHEEAMYG